MKRIVVIVFIVLFFIAFLVWLFIRIYNNHSEKEQAQITYALTPDEKSLIRDGDLILRHGYGFVSDVIVQSLKEKYDISHVAIVKKDSNNIQVIHSVSRSLSDFDGVQSQDINSFINDSKMNSVIVVRYKSEPGMGNSGISRRAQQYLEKQVPFDNSFDINDTSEIYCQELPWLCILNEYGVDILMDDSNSRKEHLHFDNFLDTSRFEVIINHHLRKQ